MRFLAAVAVVLALAPLGSVAASSAASSAGRSTKATATIDAKVGAATVSGGTATQGRSAESGKLSHGTPLISMSPTPASGSPPLKVAFALSSTAQGITSWGVDFGDGAKGSGVGKPPATVSHTYKKAGTYLTQFAVKPGLLSLVYTVAQVTVGGGKPPKLGLTARPTSGKHPIQVRFTITTAIPAQLVSWQVIFGDGWTASGQGRPPATVAHTYANAGTYAAFLVVSQQRKYGGVRYSAPRGGLVVTIG